MKHPHSIRCSATLIIAGLLATPLMAQTTAQERAASLRQQLAEVQATQTEMETRLQQLEEDLKPENIEKGSGRNRQHAPGTTARAAATPIGDRKEERTDAARPTCDQPHAFGNGHLASRRCRLPQQRRRQHRCDRKRSCYEAINQRPSRSGYSSNRSPARTAPKQEQADAAAHSTPCLIGEPERKNQSAEMRRSSSSAIAAGFRRASNLIGSPKTTLTTPGGAKYFCRCLSSYNP